MAKSKRYGCVPVFYFDGVHLICQNIESLHLMAKGIGLKRNHFQDKAIPHYDVWGRPKKKLLTYGNVKIVSTKKLIKIAGGVSNGNENERTSTERIR